MDKALIEKAKEHTESIIIPTCEKYGRDKMFFTKEQLLSITQSCFIAGATWQREQLESKQTKIKCSNCGAKVSSSVPKDTVIRGYVECPECITKTNVATVTHDIYKQAREQIIKELREWVNSNEGRIETDGKTWYKLVNGTDLLAKLDLLEGE